MPQAKQSKPVKETKKVTKTDSAVTKKATKTESGVAKKVVKKTEKKAAEKKTEKKVAVEGVVADAESKKRTFKICRGDGTYCSRLIGKTPKQAANKALTALLREAKREGKIESNQTFKAEFTIRETTRGSKGKEYSYFGTREKLSEPSVYTIKDGENTKEIVNHFRNKVLKFKA